MFGLGISQIKDILSEGDFKPNKTLGQNFLIQPQICKKIISNLDGLKEDKILEIGTGLGSLTIFLADNFDDVTTIDVDQKCLDATTKMLKQNDFSNVKLSLKNALKIENDFGNQFDIVCGNLPYNIATPIVMTVFENCSNLKKFIVMVQKEVAQRFVASPSTKAYGAVSVKCAYYAKARMVGDVGRGSFYPVPNVDSSLVLFEKIESPFSNKKLLFDIIEKAFTHRRKMLRVTFKKYDWYSELEKNNIFDFTKRPEELDLQDWIELAKEVEKIKENN